MYTPEYVYIICLYIQYVHTLVYVGYVLTFDMSVKETDGVVPVLLVGPKNGEYRSTVYIQYIHAYAANLYNTKVHTYMYKHNVCTCPITHTYVHVRTHT